LPWRLAGRRSDDTAQGHFCVLTRTHGCGRLEAVDGLSKEKILSGNVTRNFSLEWMKSEDLPWSDMVVYRETEDVGRRWMDVTTIVFKAPDDAKFYEFYYDDGKTEYQDQAWYETFWGDDEVECTQVEEHEEIVKVTKWVPVKKDV
jgi:hypothetical protein